MSEPELCTNEDGIDLSHAELLIDSNRGIYIPQQFAEQFGRFIADPEDTAILLTGPDHESYWDVWCDVLDNTTVYGEEGRAFTLYSDSDLWAVPFGD